MHALFIITVLVFSQLVSAKTDKFNNARFLEIGQDEDSNLFNSETILNVALDSCIEACKATKECRYINYHMDARACYFIGVEREDDSMMTHNLKKQQGYTFGNKSEWNLVEYTVCSECENHGNCQRETLQNDKYSLCRSSGCGPPPVFEGSTIRGNMFSIGYRVLYECGPGYVPSGHRTSTCRGDGTWSLSEPVCVRDCGQIQLTIDNGNVTLDQAETTTVGATATVSCKEGYKPKANKITCVNNGTWEVAMCSLIDCGQVQAIIDNGNVTVDESDNTMVGATASVSCKIGYKPNRNKMKCTKNGTWEVAVCSLRDCGTVETMNNGNVTVDTANVTTVGATASVTCSDGYTSEKSKITCQVNGTWEKTTCIRDCGAVPNIENGVVSVPDQTIVGAVTKVECNECYTNEKASIHCLTNGSWEIPTCSFAYEKYLKDKGENYTTLVAKTTQQYITSPNYPEHYDNNMLQHWLIKKPTESSTISLSFLDVDLEKSSRCYDSITLYASARNCTEIDEIFKQCDTNIPAIPINNNGSHFVLVTFKSDVSNTGRGFNMSFSIVEGSQ